MSSVRRSGKEITGIFCCKWKIRLTVEVAVVEGRGAYQKS